MIIQKMRIEDIPQLAMLYSQFWNENSCVEKMQKQFEKLQQKDTHILLSVVEENHLIGSIMGIVCEEPYGDCTQIILVTKRDRLDA